MAISSGTSRVDIATWDPENETTWDSRFAWLGTRSTRRGWERVERPGTRAG